MREPDSSAPLQSSAGGITFIVAAMLAISVNDMLIKQLSGAYPLHQMVFLRSLIGICFSFLFLHYEGGLRLLKNRYPMQHALRGMTIVLSNLCFFTGLAAIPLAEATGMFFVAPLFITLLSIPFLGERVGPYRFAAVGVGFAGMILILEPWRPEEARDVPFAVSLLPIAGALFYALNQIMTRRLGQSSKASALAIYIQAMFLIVSLLIYLIAGDGRYAEGLDNPSLLFVLRAWVWPEGKDICWLAALGLCSAIIGYCLSQAYRLANAATLAPFEYTGLPLAIFWGWFIWGDLPAPWAWAGISIIVTSGLFVFFRERRHAPVNAP